MASQPVLASTFSVELGDFVQEQFTAHMALLIACSTLILKRKC